MQEKLTILIYKLIFISLETEQENIMAKPDELKKDDNIGHGWVGIPVGRKCKSKQRESSSEDPVFLTGSDEWGVC